MALFKQYFEPESSTYTYLLADSDTREAVLIDTVDSEKDFYLAELERLGLKLKWILETHVHADHITAAGQLRDATGAVTAVGKACGAECANVQLEDEQTLVFGNEVIRVINTPGHTPGSVSYLWRDRVFTGDALLIGGCGRTDFQGGDAAQLYHSIVDRLFVLPDETLVYPGHDYKGRTVSSIGEEKRTNPRLAGKSEAEFVEIMNNLNLARPKKIDEAVPANKVCGISHAA